MDHDCAINSIELFNGRTVEYQSCLFELKDQVSIQAYTMFALNIVEIGIP